MRQGTGCREILRTPPSLPQSRTRPRVHGEQYSRPTTICQIIPKFNVTAKDLLSLRGGGLFNFGDSIGGLKARGLIREEGLFTKSNDTNTNDGYLVLPPPPPIFCGINKQICEPNAQNRQSFYPKQYRN